MKTTIISRAIQTGAKNAQKEIRLEFRARSPQGISRGRVRACIIYYMSMCDVYIHNRQLAADKLRERFADALTHSVCAIADLHCGSAAGSARLYKGKALRAVCEAAFFFCVFLYVTPTTHRAITRSSNFFFLRKPHVILKEFTYNYTYTTLIRRPLSENRA